MRQIEFLQSKSFYYSCLKISSVWSAAIIFIKQHVFFPRKFGDFLGRNLDFSAIRHRRIADSNKKINRNEAKRSSLDFFDYFLCQDNPPKADRWFHWKKHKKMKQKVSIFFVKTICQGRSMIPLKEEKNKAKSKYMNLSLIFPDNANDGI